MVFRYSTAFGSLVIAALMAGSGYAANGCGAGYHLSRYGRCIANPTAVVVAPAPAAVAPVATGVAVVAPAAGTAVVAKRCPPHHHLNRYGVCRHN